MVGAVGVLPLLTAALCDAKKPTAPKTGVITNIVPGGASCWDVLTDAGPRPSVTIEYQPAGTDPHGAPWPLTFTCVTPDDAAKYVIGGTYP